MSFSLHKDLLSHANRLITDKQGRPSQVDLRRSVSASYYAAWHAICYVWSTKFAGDLHPKLARCPNHNKVKSAAGRMRGQKNEWINRRPCCQRIDEMCENFIHLQKQRHEADYDIILTFFKQDAIEANNSAKQIQETITWAQKNAQEELDAFLLDALGITCPKRD